MSEGEIISDRRNCRFRLGDFEVAMWLLNAWRRFILPLAVSRIRLRAPRFVFIFGIAVLSLSVIADIYLVDLVIGVKTMDRVLPTRIGIFSILATSFIS